VQIGNARGLARSALASFNIAETIGVLPKSIGALPKCRRTRNPSAHPENVGEPEIHRRTAETIGALPKSIGALSNLSILSC
jgi:hypothetical protein